MTLGHAQSFDGAFEFAWLDTPNGDHRDMRVLNEVSFTDQSGKKWTVIKDSVINGASIPRLLWTFAGSPYVGKYRRASVIHDYYCDIRTELQSNVHVMFREAMFADGASFAEAWSKYTAVKFAGLCPEKEGVKPLTVRERISRNSAGIFADDVIQQMQSPALASETSAQKFARDQAAARRNLNEAERAVFDILLELRNSETEENLAALERNLGEFPLEAERYEGLVEIVDAIYPTNFR